MSNIREVARLAEVSVATVSRALQQPELVSVKTRNKVLAAVKQAGYQPNLLAVKFRSGKSHNLVVLVPTVANVFFARVISGMQEAAQQRIASQWSLEVKRKCADVIIDNRQHSHRLGAAVEKTLKRNKITTITDPRIS